jgi:hypothetical protein
MVGGSNGMDVRQSGGREMERVDDRNGNGRLWGEGAEVVRLWPIRVLVISADRYYRSAAAMLIGRRGCSALTAAHEQEAIELAGRECVDVVVLERPVEQERRGWEVPVQSLAASMGLAMARQGLRVAPIGVVVVSDAPAGAGRRGASPLTFELDKWGPFEELFRAIGRADRARRLPRERRHLPWPASLRQARAD